MSWYAAYTQPRSEVKAAHHLMEQGFEIYLPRYSKRRSHARRIDTVSAPLFPGYVFVAMDIERVAWRCIDSTVGVSYLVRRGDRPAAVPADVIDALRATEDDQGHIKFNLVEHLRPGEQVSIMGGPFDSLVGTFARMNDRERVVVLLELMGRPTPTVVPRELLRRCQ